MRIEVKCPCCNKYMYVDIKVQDKHMEDLHDKIRREEEAQRKSIYDSMTDEQKAIYSKMMADLTGGED